MAGKRRSGLAIHRRAYQFAAPPVVSSQEPPSECREILLSEFATQTDGETWTQTQDITILLCQTLTVPTGFSLVLVENLSFTNNGTIDGYGIIVNEGATFINNSVILTYENAGFANVSGIATNNGNIEIETTGIIFNQGLFTNSANATITCNGTFTNQASFTNQGQITTTGTFTTSNFFSNPGTLNNDAGGEFINDGTLQIIQNGIFNINSGTFTNNDQFLIQGNAQVVINGAATSTGPIVTQTSTTLISYVSFANEGNLTNSGLIEFNGATTNISNNFVNSTNGIMKIGNSLVNDGEIVNSGLIYNSTFITNNILFINDGIIINNIEPVDDPEFEIFYGLITNDGTFTGIGTIYNNGTGDPDYTGVLTNNAQWNQEGLIYNNWGVIINSETGIFDNTGQIYNFNDGRITNDGTFNQNGQLDNPVVDAGCGVGILDGTTPVVASGTACPPP